MCGCRMLEDGPFMWWAAFLLTLSRFLLFSPQRVALFFCLLVCFFWTVAAAQTAAAKMNEPLLNEWENHLIWSECSLLPALLLKSYLEREWAEERKWNREEEKTCFHASSLFHHIFAGFVCCQLGSSQFSKSSHEQCVPPVRVQARHEDTETAQ